MKLNIVLNLGLFLNEEYEEMCEEIGEIKEACHGATLKVILETGALKTAANIHSASILSQYSGGDFLKTSTGKIYAGASPEAVYVMCHAIKSYYNKTKTKTGIKVSGGVSSVKGRGEILHHRERNAGRKRGSLPLYSESERVAWRTYY